MKRDLIVAAALGLINAFAILFWGAQIGTVAAVYVLQIVVSGLGVAAGHYAQTRDALRAGAASARPWSGFAMGTIGVAVLLGMIGLTAGLIFADKGADVFTGERAPEFGVVALSLVPMLVGAAFSLKGTGAASLPTEDQVIRPIVYLALGSIPVLALLLLSDAIAEGNYKAALIAYVVAKALIDAFLAKARAVHGA